MHPLRVFALVVLLAVLACGLVMGLFTRHDLLTAPAAGRPLDEISLDLYGIGCCLVGLAFGLMVWIADRGFDRDQMQ